MILNVFFRYFITALLAIVALSSFGKSLEAYFSYATFFSPGTGPYIETYLSVSGNSIVHQLNDSGKYQGSIEVTYVFKQGDEIKKFKKYNLLSPELQDTANGFVNFIDQQRIPLDNGNYSFEIKIKDNYSSQEPFTSSQPLKIHYPEDKITISDIQLVESYEKADEPSILTKSGYDLVPYVSDYYPASLDKISFYAEIYNSKRNLGENEKYLVNYFIEAYETGTIWGNKRGFSRKTANDVNVVFNEFNIADVPSGNYNLVIEIRDRNNEKLEEKKLFFQRSNPAMRLKREDIESIFMTGSFVESINNKDTLEEHIRSIKPISSTMERTFIENNLDGADLALMQKFFLSFWRSRNQMEPHTEWLKYRKEVIKTDKSFGSRYKKGYETDQGRVYLKYGPPNSITKRPNEPSAYPYEIWHYYKIRNKANARFIFYSPDFVSKDYVLLHSNVIGEVNDYRWQVKLHGRHINETDIDMEEGRDHYGGRQEEFFTNPR